MTKAKARLSNVGQRRECGGQIGLVRQVYVKGDSHYDCLKKDQINAFLDGEEKIMATLDLSNDIRAALERYAARTGENDLFLAPAAYELVEAAAGVIRRYGKGR